jgi:hypothetical protein
MTLYDPLPYCRLGIDGLAIHVVDDLGGSPANLQTVLRTASLFSQQMSAHVLVGEARQAQIETAAILTRVRSADRVLTHLLVAMTAVRAVAIRVDVAHGHELSKPSVGRLALSCQLAVRLSQALTGCAATLRLAAPKGACLHLAKPTV